MTREQKVSVVAFLVDTMTHVTQQIDTCDDVQTLYYSTWKSDVDGFVHSAWKCSQLFLGYCNCLYEAAYHEVSLKDVDDTRGFDGPWC